MAGAIAFSQLCGFHDKQWRATETADCKRFVLYGGSRGPGKSYWLRWYPVRQLLRLASAGVTGAHWGLFCETYEELKDRHISRIEMEFPAWLGRLKESRKFGLGFFLDSQYGNGALLLRNLDDPEKYKSVEFAGVSIDEITRIPKNKFDILRGSLRWPGVARTQCCAATNPDGRHADWVRKLWIERDFSGEGFEELRGLADEFAFVQAFPQDNPHLSPEYWQDLETAPRHLRGPWLHGDWYAPLQGVVYEEFGDANLTDDGPDAGAPFELGCDDGYIDPRVMLFIQRTGTRVLVFDEIYESKQLDEASVMEMLRRCARWAGRELPASETTLESASAWCMAHGVRLPEIAACGSESVQLMRRLKQANVPARGCTHEIVEGIKLVRGMVRDGRGYRALQVNRRCVNLIHEMTRGYRYPDGRRANEKPEDKDNHACDALRYWVWLRGRR